MQVFDLWAEQNLKCKFSYAVNNHNNFLFLQLGEIELQTAVGVKIECTYPHCKINNTQLVLESELTGSLSLATFKKYQLKSLCFFFTNNITGNWILLINAYQILTLLNAQNNLDTGWITSCHDRLYTPPLQPRSNGKRTFAEINP